MASIASCPQCGKQLSVPETATSDDHAECPLCEATFLLANVVQLAVPAARIIKLSETSEVPESTTHELPAAKDAEVGGLPSWEARLKRAIETDSTEMSDRVEAEEESVDRVEVDSRPIDRPEFEFHIDPPSQAEAFAPKQTEEPNEEMESVVDPGDLFEADLGSHEIVAEIPKPTTPANHEAPAFNLQTNSPRRPRRHSWAKMAAVIAGPGVLGTLLGLYALLWLRGPSADFVGLANYLPEALLPAPTTLAADVTLLADTPSPIVAKPERVADAQQPIAETLMETTPPLIHHDETVQTAAAEQPIATPPMETGLSVEQFAVLVAAATNAMPGLVEGDLSTAESLPRKGRAYMTLCQLAEHFDFVHQAGLAPAAQTEIDRARALFGHLFANVAAQGDLSTIAYQWWGHTTKSNQGIFFAGQIEKTRPMDNRTLCLVIPDGLTATDGIPVLVERMGVSVGSQIGVVGRIAVTADQELARLGIDLPKVVVSQQSYDLPQPDKGKPLMNANKR